MAKTETCEGLVAPGSMRPGESFFAHSVHCSGCISVVGAEARKERELLLAVVGILLEGKPGAATNAVREDYPEFAVLIDRGGTSVTERITELEREIKRLHGLLNKPVTWPNRKARRKIAHDLIAMRTLAGELAVRSRTLLDNIRGLLEELAVVHPANYTCSFKDRPFIVSVRENTAATKTSLAKAKEMGVGDGG